MTIAFAALHQPLRYRSEDTRLHVLAFEDHTFFFSRRQPPFYDTKAQPIAPREVPPGSRVNVRYHEQGGQKWMDAIQILCLAHDPAPFDPVGDGHL
jgi:hypothetical protein